jgi:hypothetical protein
MSILIILGGHASLSANLVATLSNHNNVVVCERIQEQERPHLTLHLKANDITNTIVLAPADILKDTQVLPPRGSDPPTIKQEPTVKILPQSFGLCAGGKA